MVTGSTGSCWGAPAGQVSQAELVARRECCWAAAGAVLFRQKFFCVAWLTAGTRMAVNEGTSNFTKQLCLGIHHFENVLGIWYLCNQSGALSKSQSSERTHCPHGLLSAVKCMSGPRARQIDCACSCPSGRCWLGQQQWWRGRQQWWLGRQQCLLIWVSPSKSCIR